MWLLEEKIRPFDFDEGDVVCLKGTLKASTTLRKQVILGYYVACTIYGIDPTATLERAGFQVVQ